MRLAPAPSPAVALLHPKLLSKAVQAGAGAKGGRQGGHLLRALLWARLKTGAAPSPASSWAGERFSLPGNDRILGAGCRWSTP